MFVILVSYTKPLSEVDRYLADHRAFLDRFYSAGKLVASGPQNPRNGGVILCLAADKDEVWSIVRQDPFYANGIARYDMVEFEPTKAAEGFEKLLLK